MDNRVALKNKTAWCGGSWIMIIIAVSTQRIENIMVRTGKLFADGSKFYTFAHYS